MVLEEIELLSSPVRFEANRLSLESLHEAGKLLQSVGYSVDKKSAQDRKQTEGFEIRVGNRKAVIKPIFDSDHFKKS